MKSDLILSRPSTLIMAVAIFAIALAVRLTYLYEIRTIPFFEHPAVDGRVYDAWAQRIAAGDWLGDQVFYQAPAYSYFLGLMYATMGRDLWLVHVVQMLMGALACVLLFLAGREAFGARAGAAAGLLLAFYTPAIFFDGIIQKVGLGLFLMTLFLLLAAHGQRRPALGTFSLCGAALGLLALTWETTLAFLIVLPIWVAIRFREIGWRRRTSWAAALIGGCALVLLPVACRNYWVGGTFALTTSQMGTNFYIGNNPEANGLYAPLRPGRQEPEYEQRDALELAQQALGRDLTAGEVSRYWLGRGIDFVREKPGAWLTLFAHKWELVWNRFEIPDAEDIALYSEWSGLLHALSRVMHFGVLAPLAVAGMVLAWPQRREAVLPFALMVTMAAGVAAFYVFARYRFPLVPILALFAGAAIGETLARIRPSASDSQRASRVGPRRGSPALAFALAVMMAWWVNRPILQEDFSRSVSYANLGAVCAAQGRPDEAERYLRRALAMYPDSVTAHRHLGILLAERGRLSESAAHLQKWLALEPDSADGHARLARILSGLGQADPAVTHYWEAIRLKPNAIEPRRELADLFLAAGRSEEAGQELEKLALLKSTASQPASESQSDAKSLGKRGAQLAGVGRLVEAIELFRQAIGIDAQSAELHFQLAEVLVRMNRLEEAVGEYRRAVEINPKLADAHNNLGMTFGRLNDPQSAEKHYRLAIEAAPDLLSAHYNRGTVLAHLGRYAEAAEEMQRCLDLLPAQGRTDLEPRIKDRLETFRAEAIKGKTPNSNPRP